MSQLVDSVTVIVHTPLFDYDIGDIVTLKCDSNGEIICKEWKKILNNARINNYISVCFNLKQNAHKNR